jgi:16S rRNA processing protein RimM
VTVVASTDNPDRFATGSSFLTDEDEPRRLTVAEMRRHHGYLLIRFEGCEDRDNAEALRGLNLTIAPEERRPLEEGEYWPQDLEGLIALDRSGDRVGVVTGVVLADAQDRLVITTSTGSEVEIPFVDELVSEVHPSGGFVVVMPPEGLLDD